MIVCVCVCVCVCDVTFNLCLFCLSDALALFAQNQISYQQLSEGIPLAQIATYTTKILNSLVIYGFVDWTQVQVPVVPFLIKLQQRFVDCVNAGSNCLFLLISCIHSLFYSS
jgi:hypothetical protein